MDLCPPSLQKGLEGDEPLGFVPEALLPSGEPGTGGPSTSIVEC